MSCFPIYCIFIPDSWNSWLVGCRINYLIKCAWFHSKCKDRGCNCCDVTDMAWLISDVTDVAWLISVTDMAWLISVTDLAWLISDVTDMAWPRRIKYRGELTRVWSRGCDVTCDCQII